MDVRQCPFSDKSARGDTWATPGRGEGVEPHSTRGGTEAFVNAGQLMRSVAPVNPLGPGSKGVLENGPQGLLLGPLQGCPLP